MGPGAKMTCEGPGGEEATFDVEMIIGLRRIQMFTTTMPDGRIQVLPVFLEVPKKAWFDRPTWKPWRLLGRLYRRHPSRHSSGITWRDERFGRLSPSWRSC